MTSWLTAVSIWSLVTPAFIASVVSLFITNRAEKLRAHRDWLTKTFEGARDDVRQAIAAAAGYFPLAAAKRTPLLEAQVWMTERELRFSLTAIIDNSAPEIAAEVEDLTRAFDDLITQLTGGSFQSANAAPDLKQVRRIAAAGAELRSRLVRARHAELLASIRKDPLSRFLIFWREVPGGPLRG